MISVAEHHARTQRLVVAELLVGRRQLSEGQKVEGVALLSAVDAHHQDCTVSLEGHARGHRRRVLPETAQVNPGCQACATPWAAAPRAWLADEHLARVKGCGSQLSGALRNG